MWEVRGPRLCSVGTLKTNPKVTSLDTRSIRVLTSCSLYYPSASIYYLSSCSSQPRLQSVISTHSLRPGDRIIGARDREPWRPAPRTVLFQISHSPPSIHPTRPNDRNMHISIRSPSSTLRTNLPGMSLSCSTRPTILGAPSTTRLHELLAVSLLATGGMDTLRLNVTGEG
jgi:hypothetical protein